MTTPPNSPDMPAATPALGTPANARGEAESPPAPVPVKDPRGRFALPAWSLSVVIHMLLVIVLGLTIQLVPSGAAVIPNREVGIVLKQYDRDGEEYFTDGQDQELIEDPFDSDSQSDAVNTALAERPSTINSNSVLPTDLPLIGVGSDAGGGPIGNAASMAEGAGRRRNPAGGKASASVFGVPGEGYSFVYVFDRSTSMGGPGYSPLEAAKAELLESLDSLAETHEFQIIFYNQNPSIFNPSGRGRLSLADERSKDTARRFVGGITAAGSTNHEAALKAALNLRPDVIFFLTDAEEPQLSQYQLSRIKRLNSGASICAIEFGAGPEPSGDNFLKQLARDNGGRHGYVDITRLRRKP